MIKTVGLGLLTDLCQSVVMSLEKLMNPPTVMSLIHFLDLNSE